MSQLLGYVPTALLGLQQSTPPGISGIAANLFTTTGQNNITQNETAERYFLQQVAVISLCEQAGFVPTVLADTETINDNQPVFLPVTHSDDNKFRYCLQQMPGDALVLRLEILNSLQPVKALIPPAVWPLLFNLVGSNGACDKAIRQLTTPYGKWLAQQNPAWQSFALIIKDEFSVNTEGEYDDIWRLGNRQARLTYFEALRQKAPQQAVALLEQDAKDIKAVEKVGLIGLLAQQLSHADIPYLETQLQHRSEQVRLASRNLLRVLPESHYVERLQTSIQQRLKLAPQGKGLLGLFNKKLQIDLNWPSDLALLNLDFAALAISTDTKQAQALSLSVPEYVLQQSVAAIPLSFWEQTYQATPSVLLTAALDCIWAQGLLRGWFEQILLSQNSAWATAAFKASTKLKKVMLAYSYNAETSLLACLPLDEYISYYWNFAVPPQGIECFQQLSVLVGHLPNGFYFDKAQSISLAETIYNSATTVLASEKPHSYWGIQQWSQIAYYLSPELITASNVYQQLLSPAVFDSSAKHYSEWLAWRKTLHTCVANLFARTSTEHRNCHECTFK